MIIKDAAWYRREADRLLEKANAAELLGHVGLLTEPGTVVTFKRTLVGFEYTYAALLVMTGRGKGVPLWYLTGGKNSTGRQGPFTPTGFVEWLVDQNVTDVRVATTWANLEDGVAELAEHQTSVNTLTFGQLVDRGSVTDENVNLRLARLGLPRRKVQDDLPLPDASGTDEVGR